MLAQAAASTAAPLINRLKACLGWGDISMRAGRPDDALAGLETAVELLPQLVPRQLTRVDREYGLARIAGLGGRVATAAIAANAPARAVELLEQSRGLLLTEALDARRDLTDLRAHVPDLAAEFDQVREAFDAADRASLARSAPTADDTLLGDPTPEETMRHEALLRLAERRDSLAGQWQSLLARIRAQPRFERFLLPPPIAEIQRQAVDGPIVFVMTSPWRCDALILTAHPDRPVTVVPLSGLTEEAAREQASQFAAARDRAAAGSLTQRRQAQHDLNRILAWLWTAVTEPVLAVLGIIGPPASGSSWPRLWWCPVGVMTQLPLHAAGRHDERQAADAPSVMARAVCSYTATIRALAHAREGAARAAAADNQPALIVAMAETPGAPTLAWVPDLAALLPSLLPGTFTLTGEQATRDAVLSRLPDYPIAHFACHGLSDMTAPDASRLLLHDYASAPLTVTEIARLQLSHASLAYLSACSTTSTAPLLADEAIHITAAFQTAGYHHVIGTLAPVGDQAAAEIDTAFYVQITSNGTRPARVDRAAQALHDTLRQLRDEYPLLTTRWALHIHAGI